MVAKIITLRLETDSNSDAVGTLKQLAADMGADYSLADLTPDPVRSECCHDEVGYDAYVDSNGDVNQGPFDFNLCNNCGYENPPEWDGKTPPWPKDMRQNQTVLPEGVDEPTPEEAGKWREVGPGNWPVDMPEKAENRQK